MSDIVGLASEWGAAWAGKDTDRFVALFTPDAVYRDDQAGRVSRGSADLRSFHAHFASAISNLSFEFSAVFQAGSHACFEWTSIGTHTGVFHGRPPTGKTFRMPGVSVLQIAPDGRISSCVDYYDALRLTRQISPSE